jgi:hypothetical protein
VSEWFGSQDNCVVCGLAPTLFVSNSSDALVSLYCPDCGGIYRAPDQGQFAYGDRRVDFTTFRPATRSEFERAGHAKFARRVPPPERFPGE